MKKVITWWALKDKKGKILQSTIKATKDDCWYEGFWLVANAEGDAWLKQYWKAAGPSMRSALKLGYSFCRVAIKEVA